MHNQCLDVKLMIETDGVAYLRPDARSDGFEEPP